MRASFEPVLKALGPARQSSQASKDVVTVRPGYALSRRRAAGAGGRRGRDCPAPRRSTPRDLERKFGVPFAVTDATVEEQTGGQSRRAPVAFGAPDGPTASAFEKLLGGEEALDFGPPKTGAMRQLDPPNLPLVDEKMKLTICVSPEAGWSELESFLAAPRSGSPSPCTSSPRRTSSRPCSAAVTPAGRQFELVLHPVPEKPPKSASRPTTSTRRTRSSSRSRRR